MAKIRKKAHSDYLRPRRRHFTARNVKIILLIVLRMSEVI